MTDQYNTGHFERGVFIPECNQCGACCRYHFFRVKRDPEDEKDGNFLLSHYQGIQIIGEVAYFPAQCRHLNADNKCAIHDDPERPDCCTQFGYGGYHHPIMCAFFGGEEDKKYYPDDYRHRLQEQE